MCKFCDILDGNYYGPLFSEDIVINGKQRGDLQLWIDQKLSRKGKEMIVDKPALHAYVDDMFGDIYIEGRIHINYCPICGEKIEA